MSYYEILGVANDASNSEIKKAYRILAKKHHPDKEGGNSEKFLKISEAYEHLIDDNKRKKYDFANNHNNGMDTSFFEQFQFSSNFSEMFNSSFGSNVRGSDVRISIQITIQESYTGVERIISLGSSRLKLKIPKGILNGTKIKMTGKGEAHPLNTSAPNGDVIITCHVLPDPLIVLNGADIWTDITVPFYDLILGTEVVVKNPLYSIKVTIPKDSYHGKVLRIKEYGMPVYLTKKKGNLMVKLNVSMSDLNDEQYKLINDIKSIALKNNYN